MVKRTALFLVASTLVLFSCKTTEFGYKVLAVNGMVYDFSNRPVPNYKITIGKKYTSTTDINGRFLIEKVPVGTYAMRGERAGYETYQSDITISQKEQIIYIRLPSFNQLLELADAALVKNQINEAEAYLLRAVAIEELTTELFFYLATVQFRQKNYQEAQETLQSARDHGLADIYVEKFLADLKRMHDENIF
ncbi:hypothetical protein AGMMS50267_10000 [Spirochaetia bacterium]|nr:hypothetical protein AGMMS50267_10000 [Spirochaetia bacterium]